MKKAKQSYQTKKVVTIAWYLCHGKPLSSKDGKKKGSTLPRNTVDQKGEANSVKKKDENLGGAVGRNNRAVSWAATGGKGRCGVKKGALKANRNV